MDVLTSTSTVQCLLPLWQQIAPSGMTVLPSDLKRTSVNVSIVGDFGAPFAKQGMSELGHGVHDGQQR